MKSTDHVLSALRSLSCWLVVAGLSACATRTNMPVHPADLPLAYLESSAPDSAPLAVDWWRSYGADELSALMDAALRANPDWLMATERVRQAQAQTTLASASLLPALNLAAGASGRETRGHDSQGSSAFNTSLNASYEVDLWGQNRSRARAAELAVQAARYDRQSVRLTLLSGVASAYFQLLSVRDRLRLAQDNIRLAERVFKVVSVRAQNGAASALDVARQQSALLGPQAALLPLALQERQLLYALAILVDQSPQGFAVRGATVLDLRVPEVAPGLPASLLTRRPDLASAEAQLAAANANVAVARAALLPSISLTGSAGMASSLLSDLVNAPVVAFSIGASLLQPIFNAGSLRAQVDVAASRERELILNYHKVIQAALVDVESALAARSRLGSQELLLAQSLHQAARALRLAEVRYREGADDLIVLLDAQRTLFQAQDQGVQQRLNRLQTTLDLLMALGGGWNAASE